MAVVSTQSTPYEFNIHNWWPGSGGNYYEFSVDVSIWVEYDTDTHKATFHSSQKNWTDGYQLNGGGFVDCYGLFFDPGSSVGKSTTDSSGGSQAISVAQGVEYFKQGLRDIGYCAQTSNPLNWCVGGVAIDNLYHNKQRFGESGATYTKTFSQEEFENINSYLILGLGTRYLDQASNQAVINMKGYTIYWADLFPQWIPWSVYYPNGSSTTNYSCNRNVTTESGVKGNLQVFDTSWHTVYNGGDSDNAWYHDGNKWQQSPKFGRFKDE